MIFRYHKATHHSFTFVRRQKPSASAMIDHRSHRVPAPAWERASFPKSAMRGGGRCRLVTNFLLPLIFAPPIPEACNRVITLNLPWGPPVISTSIFVSLSAICIHTRTDLCKGKMTFGNLFSIPESLTILFVALCTQSL